MEIIGNKEWDRIVCLEIQVGVFSVYTLVYNFLKIRLTVSKIRLTVSKKCTKTLKTMILVAEILVKLKEGVCLWRTTDRLTNSATYGTELLRGN